VKQEEILLLDLTSHKLCYWLSNGLLHRRQDMIAMEMVMITFPAI